MTIDEYQSALEALSPEALQQFKNDFGGGTMTIEQHVRGFVHDPEHEGRICQLLGLKTEADKRTEAAVTSARAADQSAASARRSASSARWSIVVSVITCIVAGAALIVSIFALLKKG